MKNGDRKFIDSNNNLWDEWAEVHIKQQPEGYAIDNFKAGETALTEIELAALPDVQGKSMLHLMCHFGLDTLSWARKGAVVTGIDLSSVAIEYARKLSQECAIPANLICSNIYDIKEHLDVK